jgi:2-oxoglutarate ferredoxin oxidoreductase subunit alpha
VQECADLTYLAFDLADKYRTPVIVLADGMIGQKMEGVILPPEKDHKDLPKRDWAVGNMAGSGRNDSRHITSIHLVPEELEKAVQARYVRYEDIKKNELRFEAVGYRTACNEFTGEGPDLTLVAYGTSARICLGAKKLAEKEGIKLGIFRPITVWPFPYAALGKVAATGKPLLTVEMSMGQMVEDVKLSVLEAVNKGAKPVPVHLLGHVGGVIPTEEEVFAEVKKILGRK